MFGIAKRIKHIDKGYFIVFDSKTQRYEVHNKNQSKSTYCLTSPYRGLDKRLLDYVCKTSLQYNKNLIMEIERHNEEIEKNYESNQRNYIESNLKDIYKVTNNSTKNYEIDKSLKNVWL